MRVSSFNYDHGLSVQYFVRSIAPILLLITSSSAVFERALFVKLEESSVLWKGKPSVNILSKNYRVCADDTYWSIDVADTICRYRGFEGTMLIKEITSDPQHDYVVCRRNIEANRFECEATDACDKEPIVSCILPRYLGCFINIESNPFFVNGAQASNSESLPYDIETCATACVQYEYMGLTDGQDCICGSTLGNMDEGVCDSVCLQNEFEMCGGADAISVYDGNVIGKCSSEQTMQDLLPNIPTYVLSPQFPDTYDAGSVCTWTLTLDVAESHNLGVSATFDLHYPADGNVNASSISKRLSMYSQGVRSISGTSFNPYPVLQDTITVVLTTYGASGGSFFINFSLTPHSTEPTEPSLMTETQTDKTETHSLSPSVPSSPSSSTTLSSISSPSPSPSTPPSSSSSTSSFFSSRFINEQAIFAGVGVTVAAAIVLALGVVFIVLRGRTGGSFGSGKEKPVGLVGYHNGGIDIITTPSHHTPTLAHSGLDEENHTYATIADDHYLVPDAIDNAKIEAEELKGRSSERVTIPNDYKL